MKTEIETDAPPLFYIPLLTGVGIRVFSADNEKHSFTVLRKDATKAVALLQTSGKSATVRQDTFAQAVLRRSGLLIGCLFVAVLLFISAQTVTDISVVGNDTLSADVIKEEILSLYSLPSPKNKIDCTAVETVLTRLDGVAYASVSVRGTSLCVTVSEEIPSVGRVGGQTCTCTYDGIVTEINLTSGHPLVRVGDTVRRGQILAEGDVVGSVVGRVWFSSSRIYPPEQTVFVKTGRTEIVYSASEEIAYRGKFSLYERKTEKVSPFVLPVSVYKITYYEVTERTEQTDFEKNFDALYTEQLSALEKTLPSRSEKTKTWFFKKTVDKTGYLDIYYEVTTVLYENEEKQGAQ